MIPLSFNPTSPFNLCNPYPFLHSMNYNKISTQNVLFVATHLSALQRHHADTRFAENVSYDLSTTNASVHFVVTTSTTVHHPTHSSSHSSPTFFQTQHTIDPSIHDLENDDRVPLLIGNLAFPHTTCSIHIFEPRYRLMLRRIMSSSRRRFAMCLSRRQRRSPHDAPFYEYGTMLELMHVQTLADGRSIVEAVGSHRFKVTRSELIDGYHMAEIERIDDMDSEQESMLEQSSILKATADRARLEQQQPQQQRPLSMTRHTTMLPAAAIGHRQSWAQQAHPQTQNSLKKAPWLQMHVRGLSAARAKPPLMRQVVTTAPTVTVRKNNHQLQSTEEILNDIIAFIEKLMQHKQAGNSTWLNALGETPLLRGPQRDRVALTWWVVNMMPLGEEEKYTLLAMRSFRERLLVISSWVDRFQDQWSFFLNIC